MDKARSGGLGRLGATVVARRCRRGGVACKSLDHGKIGTGIKGRRHERSAQIVRRAPRDSGFLGTLAQASHERVRGDAATGINRAGLRHRSEDRAGHGDPAVCQPRIEGCPCTAGRIDDALAVALADDAHGAGVRFVVGNLHGHRFGAAQAAAKEQGEGSRVAGAGRGAVGTDGKQRPDLGGFEGPAGRQARTANGRHVDRPVIAIGGHQIQAPGGPQDTADGGERLVRRGGRVALGQHGAQGRNVMMAQFLPGAGRGIAETEHGGELGERRGHRAPPLTGRQARKIDGRRIALRRESLGGGNRQNGHGSSRLPGTCILDQVSRPSGNGAGSKLTALAAVVALSGGLAACGSSSTATNPSTPSQPAEGAAQTPQQMCETGGGQWDASTEQCTDAETLRRQRAEDSAKAGRLIAGAIEGGMPGWVDTDGDVDGRQMPFVSDGRMFMEAPHTTNNADDDFAMSERMPIKIEDWAGTSHMRMTIKDDEDTMDMNEAVIDMVVSYTDETDKKDQAYAEFFGQTGASQPGGVSGYNADDGVITIAQGEVGANYMEFSGDFGITAANQLIPAPVDDEGTSDVDEAMVEVKGSFYGVDGTFSCPSTCTRSSDKDGKLSGLGGSWTFKPTSTMLDDLMVPGVVRDDDYLTFGYWTRDDYKGKDGSLRRQFAAFARGVQQYSDVSAVTGTASYKGKATGLFATKKFDPNDGSPIPTAGGQFTANVSLKAYFSQDTDQSIAPNRLNTISGEINNFLNDAGEMIDKDWTLMLEGTNHAHTSNTGAGGTFSGMTKGDTEMMDGTFSGTFHGGDDSNTADVVEMPDAVTGIFDGHFSDGHVAGAFGAPIVVDNK